MFHPLRILMLICLIHLAAMAAVPTITSLNISKGTVDGGVPVIVYGSGLMNAVSVTFGGAPATGLVIASDGTRISLRTPAHGSGYVDVRVTSPDGIATKYGIFQYIDKYRPAFATQPSSLPQDDGGVPVFSTGQSEALAIVNKTYSYALTVTGNPAPTVTLSGDATGVVITNLRNPNAFVTDGDITWVPTAPGLKIVTVTARNSMGSVQQTVRIRAIPAPSSLVVDGVNVKAGSSGSRRLKIMCLGDSITVGRMTVRNGVYTSSYRGRLLTLLTDAGYSVQMVGRSNDGNNAGSTNLLHEGNSGYRVGKNLNSERAASLISIVNGFNAGTKVIEQFTPDLVVLMGGNLDLNFAYSSAVPPDYAQTLDFGDFATERMGRLVDAIEDPALNANTQPRIVLPAHTVPAHSQVLPPANDTRPRRPAGRPDKDDPTPATLARRLNRPLSETR